MVILAINTATSNTEIALLGAESSPGNASSHKQNAKVLAERSWKSANNEAEKLMPEIAGLLEEAGNSPGTVHSHKQQASTTNSGTSKKNNFGTIGHVVVVKGPGSFTGLRIGITVANTIAYLNGCGLTGLSTFEYLHRRISNKTAGASATAGSATTGSADIPVLLFAGKGGVYLSETSDSEPKLIDLPDLSEAVKKFEKVSGDISDEQKEVLKSAKSGRSGKDISDEQKEKLSPVTTSGPKFIEPKKSFGEVMVEFIKDIPGDVCSHKQHKPSKGEINLVKPLYVKQPAITKSKRKIMFA